VIDLFEPPQREQIRPRAAELASARVKQRDIAAQLGVTQTAVQKALALEGMMRERGLESPYAVVTEPPADYPKLRRHKNRKFRFKPADGYVPPGATASV
jgi:site-specific DNA recombinase